MAPISPIRSVTKSEIPDKLYFKIGEVARLCEVPAYVLRFWESEFPQLKPNKGGTGQRLYRRKDVEMAVRIKRLLYDEGYTIPGARQVFKAEVKQKEPKLFQAAPEATAESAGLAHVRKELQHIAALLSRPAPGLAAESSRSREEKKGVVGRPRAEPVNAKEPSVPEGPHLF